MRARRAQGSGRVLTFDPAHIDILRNDHSAEILLFDDRFGLLCNVPGGQVGVTTGETREAWSRIYVSSPRLEDVLESDTPDTVIPAEVLNAPPDAADLSALDPTERKAIRYWAEDRIGDCLFNAWD